MSLLLTQQLLDTLPPLYANRKICVLKPWHWRDLQRWLETDHGMSLKVRMLMTMAVSIPTKSGWDAILVFGVSIHRGVEKQ